ncbi:molybdate ABC transporter substrate-binding protein [Massilia eurypsychrophila]|jgi:molybdate transport system substrate-binding protein|uniref:Molybdate ABC transporter substrate-binding protein n=1 Tax=Massilia eurypsychrophila TaxID=1485217 RepID=A0A2G8TM57_9BURK|nr:molybdate ABC transporter substrate-binding protein [Massilia eurypsychrophila]PIL46688.1 molybdate ABC transporter substrate-binding protein [Massilia eurypsychrophila]
MKRLLLLLTLLLTLPARAETLLVAAASDLSYCIDELGAAFSKAVPQAQLKVSTGASGNFFAQIRHGAPFEVFLSADMDYPAQLARDGAAVAATLTPYAVGRIVLWTLDARFDVQQGMRVFDDARLTRVALANPAVAPYGRAAKAALEAAGKWPALQPKLVIGENIAQAVQFVQTGNAQIGIVSLASVVSPRLKGLGSYYLLPEAGMAPIVQGAVVTAQGRNNPLATRFVQFLSTPGARAILQRHGFGMPPTPAAPRG